MALLARKPLSREHGAKTAGAAQAWRARKDQAWRRRRRWNNQRARHRALARIRDESDIIVWRQISWHRRGVSGCGESMACWASASCGVACRLAAGGSGVKACGINGMAVAAAGIANVAGKAAWRGCAHRARRGIRRASAAWRGSIGAKWRKAIITANGNEAAGGVEEIGGEGKWRKSAAEYRRGRASNGSGIKW
jgi:hypothetical protein